MSKTYEVIIAGGGPVGWFVAHELGLAGVSALVLERDADPQSPWKTAPMGRRGLNVASSEAFYRRGLLRDVFEPDEQPEPFKKTDSFQFAGHFAGIMLDYNKLEPERLKYKLRGPSLLGGPTSLERIESILCARAQKLGVEVRRGTEVTGLSQDSGAVTVQAGGQSFSCRWLVGSDGGRSTVRKAAGSESVGSDAEFTGYAVLCDLDDPNKLEPGIQLHKNGVTAVGGPGHVYVMDYQSRDFDRTQEVTREHFQEVLRRVSGVDVTVKAIRLASTFTDRAKQVTAYRRGRVVLAGDSAHIHSPLGAQGLNAGIGDAMNLGWKLAAVAKGTAPEGLLDTYHAERHPVGARVLEWSRAQVATARPSLDGHAVASMLRDLIDTDAGTSYFIDRVMGLSQRYDLGDDEPWVGRSAPDFEFVDGTRLGAKCERGRGLLVDLEGQASLSEAVAPWKAQVDYLALRAKDTLGLKALLMRPDGVIAWAARDRPDAGKAQAALRRWFGGR